MTQHEQYMQDYFAMHAAAVDRLVMLFRQAGEVALPSTGSGWHERWRPELKQEQHSSSLVVSKEAAPAADAQLWASLLCLHI